MKRLSAVKPFIILFLFIAISCFNKQEELNRDKQDNDFIEALTYHHDFKVSAIIDDFVRNNNIDKKILTERIAQNTNFWTPLCYASFIGNTKAVKLLIEKNANINYKDNNGNTPLMLASISGNVEEIKILLEAGANINETDINNNTALIHAAAGGNILTVKYLIEKGCELQPKNNGQNALDFAIFYQHQEVIDYLISIGLTKK